MTIKKLSITSPVYFQNIFFPSNDFLTALSTFVGPVSSGLDTILSNKSAGPPGRHFTKKQKDDLLFGIYQEGLLAKEALKRFDGLGDMERAEAEFSEAQTAYAAAIEKQRGDYSRGTYDAVDGAVAALNSAKNKIDDLRAKDAKRKLIDGAKQKIKDAIARRKGH